MGDLAIPYAIVSKSQHKDNHIEIIDTNCQHLHMHKKLIHGMHVSVFISNLRKLLEKASTEARAFLLTRDDIGEIEDIPLPDQLIMSPLKAYRLQPFEVPIHDEYMVYVYTTDTTDLEVQWDTDTVSDDNLKSKMEDKTVLTTKDTTTDGNQYCMINQYQYRWQCKLNYKISTDSYTGSLDNYSNYYMIECPKCHSWVHTNGLFKIGKEIWCIYDVCDVIKQGDFIYILSDYCSLVSAAIIGIDERAQEIIEKD